MQRKNMWLAMSALVSLLWVHTEVVAQEQACYQIGETIAPEVTVVNANGEQQNLLELIDSETKLIYLVIFGGPSLNQSTVKAVYGAKIRSTICRFPILLRANMAKKA